MNSIGKILPYTNPRFRILSYQKYSQKIENEIEKKFLKNEEFLKDVEFLKDHFTFYQGKPYGVEDENNDDPIVVPYFLIVDVMPFLGNLATVITIGELIYKIIKYLRERREQKFIHRYTVNCSSTFFLALRDLKTRGVAVGRPLYFHSFGYQCLMISNDLNNLRKAHVIIYSNEGELTDYIVLTL